MGGPTAVFVAFLVIVLFLGWLASLNRWR